MTIIIYEIIISIILKLEKPKTNFKKKSISYSGVKMWNELLVELKSNCLSLNAFKTLLRDRPQHNTYKSHDIMWCTV